MNKNLVRAAALLAVSLPASTLQALELKVVDSFPAGHYLVRLINQSVWDKLPDDVKKAMDEASETITPKSCADVDKEQDTTKQHLAEGGVSFDPLPEATRAEMKDKLKGVGQEWASGLDSRGKQASAVLKEFESLLAAGGAK
ncbi:hypothetical protein [Bradyrhizobium brasilense]|uniref:hypothetical protein n=1 Tax=Bradyrhizobium brasilense TaxID=1419277 RepID=UPI001F2BB7A5|nr:hypothetical protein [Bradyrhizobium brasilense]